MSNRSFNTGASSPVVPSGLWRARVKAVDGDFVSVVIPRLGQFNVYERLPVIGKMPSVGDNIWVGFIEGRSEEPVAFGGDYGVAVSEVVAGEGLSGGGSAASVTVDFEPSELDSVSLAYDDSVVITDFSDGSEPKLVSVADVVTTANADGGEPLGHENRADSVISFTPGSRTFSIAPAADDYVVWCAGKKFVKDSTESVIIDEASGLYFISFDADGVLQSKTTYFDWASETPTAYIYFNVGSPSKYMLFDERHGVVLDWQTHEYLHRTRGAAFANGFAVSNFDTSTQDGDTDAQAQFDLAGGTFFDEDLQVDIVHSASPVANTWEQDLQGPARIPVLYRSGSAWVFDDPTDFAVKFGASPRPVYNLQSGGVWSTPEVSSNNYGVQWIVATNNLNYPVLSVMGQGQYPNSAGALNATWASLDLSDLPIVEIRVLYKVVFRASGSNVPGCYFYEIADYRTVSATATSEAPAVVDHGSLSGLGDVGDHPDYLLIDGSRVADKLDVSGGNVTVSGGDVAVSNGDVDVTTGSVSVSGGNVDVTTGDVTVSGGGVDVTTGSVTVSGGSVAVTTGSVTVSDGTISITDAAPTLRLIDNDGRSGFVHVNSDQLYLLGSTSTAATTWNTVNGVWPLQVNLLQNDVTVAGALFVDASAQYVGVGTSAPGSKLHVNGPSNPEVSITSSDGTDPALYFGDSTDRVRGGFVYDTSANMLIFRGYNNATRMVINNAGLVGIGTSSPAYTLDVNGTINATNTNATNTFATNVIAQSFLTSTSSPRIQVDFEPGIYAYFSQASDVVRIYSPSSNASTNIQFLGNNVRQGYIGYPNTDDLRIWNEAASGLVQIATNGVERVRIDSGGTFRVYTAAVFSSTVDVGDDVPGSYTVNANLNSTNGRIRRNTSSIRYKTNVVARAGCQRPTLRTGEGADDDEISAAKCVLSLDPVWYTPMASDRPGRWPGFIAEDAHELGHTHLVEYNEAGEPEGFDYARLGVDHHVILQNHEDRIDRLERLLDKLDR